MQSFGGRLLNPEWSGIFILKKMMKVYFPMPITGSFIGKIISYSLWQFIYRSAS